MAGLFGGSEGRKRAAFYLFWPIVALFRLHCYYGPKGDKMMKLGPQLGQNNINATRKWPKWAKNKKSSPKTA